MTYTISQLLDAVRPKLGGSSYSDIANFPQTVYTAIGRAEAQITSAGTKREATLSSPIYDGVTRYPLPSDFRYAIDLYPQVGREGNAGSSNFTPRFSREFSLRGEFNTMDIEWVDGIPVLDARRYPQNNVVTLSTFETTTGWTAADDASGIYSEPLDRIAGSASLGVNLSGVLGYGSILTTISPAIDFSTWNRRDSVLLWVKMPSVMTTVFIERGSSSADYYSKSVTAQQDGTAFRVGWNLLRFDLTSASTVGSPSLSSTTHFRIGVTYPIGTAIDGVLFDSATDQLGDYFLMPYYSTHHFKDPSTGAWMEFPTDLTTIINCDKDFFTLLTYVCLDDLVTELEKKGGRGSAAQEMHSNYALILGAVGKGGLFDQYARKYPSQRIAPTSTYHTFDL